MPLAGAIAGISQSLATTLPVAVEITRLPEAAPGAFSTWSYRLQSLSSQPIVLDLVLDLPNTWYAVTPERSLRLEQFDVRSIPFTAWIPQDAQADSSHIVQLKVTSQHGDHPETRFSHELVVKAKSGVSVAAVDAALPGHPGRNTVAGFMVTNTGNRSGVFELDATSIPGWPVEVSQRRLVLKPGEKRRVEVQSRVPTTARSQAVQVLHLCARGGPDGDGVVWSQDQIRITVMPDRQPISLHARLPLRAAFSVGEFEPGKAYTGLRIASSGDLNRGTLFELDVDLATGPRSHGVLGWQSQRMSLRLMGDEWDLALGDVTRWFPDLAVRSLSGRGAGLTASRGDWKARFYGGRDRVPGSTTSWAAGAERHLRPLFRVAGDLLLLEEDCGRLGTQRSELACASAAVDSVDGWNLRLEGAVSRKSVAGRSAFGGATQLFADRDGEAWLLRTRAYAGTAEFGGRTRDRDGFSAFFRTIPWAPLRIWSSGDVSGGRIGISGNAPSQKSSRVRAGSRLSWRGLPSLELTVGRSRERGDVLDSLSGTERDDLTATLSKQVGIFYSSATGRWGRARDIAKGNEGRIQGVDLSAGWRIKRVRAATRYAVSRDWSTSHLKELGTKSLTGDLSWTSRAGRVNAGFSIASRSVETGTGAGRRRRDVQVRPRADVRVSGNWSASVEASLFGFDEDPGLNRWQVQLSYSASSLIPAVWVPTQGRLEAVVFIDEDMDGEMNAEERGIPGVLLNVESYGELTDPSGTARWPLLARGTWWVELETSSLPMGLTPARPFPMAVLVEPGKGAVLHIPLLRAGRVMGMVFLDESQDGKLVAGESPLSEIRMVLLDGDRVVKESLTDQNGRYELPGVPPGLYRLRIADGWLPIGWEVTGSHDVEIQVLPGKDFRVEPYGVAPRRRPLIRTFMGEDPGISQDASGSEESPSRAN